ncbi:MAG: type I restriction enzyme HsdR N-terminal domain-containing protein [Taibaiella sp.]|nr:type I restriction enzyme HsdR N-terminal domain-containing protein [Taibaiella sp.]
MVLLLPGIHFTLITQDIMITLDFSGLQLKLKQENNVTLVYDPVRRRWVVLTPEEHVRQYILQLFIQQLRYPVSLIAVEKKIMVGKMAKRYDIVVYDRQHMPWLLAECKQPEVPVSPQTLHQLLSYQQTVQGRYWLITNGHQSMCADAADKERVIWMDALPEYEL